MTESLCAPFGDCGPLDARLLINTAFQGPPLALDLAELSFGSATAQGTAARPYLDVSVEQSWTAREACYGPVRSIFSLAPGETVQLTVDVEQRSSLVKTVVDHLPNVIEPPLFRAPIHIPTATPATPAPHRSDIDQMQKQKQKQDAVYAIMLEHNRIGAYGSFLTDLVDPLGVHKILGGDGGSPLPTPPSPAGVAGAIGGLINQAAGGGKGVIANAVGQAAKAAGDAGRAELRHTRDETSTTTTSTETHQTLTRTFANPYRDRTLQLRFVPVFRRFDVYTRPVAATPGVALHTPGFRDVERTFEAAASAPRFSLADVAEPEHPHLQTRLASMLSTTAASGAHRALAWPQAQVRSDSLLVPFAPASSAARALGLRGEERSKFVTSIDRSLVGAIAAIAAHTQSVHLFMGTHIEAVAGECVLHDLPPLEHPQP